MLVSDPSNERVIVKDVSNLLVKYQTRMNPAHPGTQQVVPVTELRATITEVVKEVLTELRAGKNSSDEVTPYSAKGR